MKLTNSLNLYEVAKYYIPSGAMTYSKAANKFPFGAYPIFLKSGSGCYVTDVDDNTYIDYISALGPCVLGYGHPQVKKAIADQLEEGVLLSMSHPKEIELAKLLTDLMPCGKDGMVKFGKNGSDVCSAAVRVSRAYTGRTHIGLCGYSGWSDSLAAHTPRNKGIPKVLKQYINTFEYGDFDALENIVEKHKLACIIMEPAIFTASSIFLKKVRKLATDHDIVLIFDEMVTAFRWALGGAQEFYRVTPDLTTLGKAMGSGSPISALIGKREIMKLFEEEVFFSGTYFDELLSVAASLETLRIMQEAKGGVQSHIWTMGFRFQDGFNAMAREIGVDAKVTGLAPRMKFEFGDEDQLALFLQMCVEAGILFHPTIIYFNFMHKERELDYTLETCYAALAFLKKTIEDDTLKVLLKGRIGETSIIRR